MNKEKINSFLLENKSVWEGKLACFVVDSKKLKETVGVLKTFLKGEVVYSYKTNPDFGIAEIISSQGCGFLFSSVEELENISNLPYFEKGKNIFQSPSLTKEQFQIIRNIGITRFVVDSQDQLDIMLENIDGSEIIELLIRVNTGVKVNNPELPYGEDSFLGFPLSEAKEVLKKLGSIREEGKIRLGIHNHLISQNTYLDMWRENTQVMADFVDDIKKAGVTIDVVDFGGGYPVEYFHPVPELSEIGSVIYEAQKRMTEAFPNVKYVFEPGRKLIGESLALIGRIAYVKKFHDTSVVILSCSLYNCSMDTLIVNLFLPVIKLDYKENSDRLEKNTYIIRGSTPDSLDVFSRGVDLPQLKDGDYLAFLHAGAYSFGSDFISLTKPKHLIV